MSILKTLKRVPGVDTIQGLAQDNIISPAKTGINAVGKYLTGFPLVGTVASGIGQMFEGDSPVDAFNRLNYSVSGNPNLKSRIIPIISIIKPIVFIVLFVILTF